MRTLLLAALITACAGPAATFRSDAPAVRTTTNDTVVLHKQLDA